MENIRATKTTEQAGAYYVRIQATARKHQIPLDVEFDEHDTPETKYIVIVDEYLPIATCRLYAIDDDKVMLGRVVVLPENRGQGIGTLVVREAERWAKELGFSVSVVESRENKIRFYETMGYVADYSKKIVGETFTCFRMEKRSLVSTKKNGRVKN
ncbi:MAG: GNAT family N-acetyltransferase [Prevotella sp.]|nr:GNAT family N-acetyltransferase [Prevotella sp.]